MYHERLETEDVLGFVESDMILSQALAVAGLNEEIGIKFLGDRVIRYHNFRHG